MPGPVAGPGIDSELLLQSKSCSLDCVVVVGNGTFGVVNAIRVGLNFVSRRVQATSIGFGQYFRLGPLQTIL